MSSHGGAVAEASPYLGSIFPVVMLQSTRPGPATHRPAAPICLVRHARTDGSDGATSVSMSPGLRRTPAGGSAYGSPMSGSSSASRYRFTRNAVPGGDRLAALANPQRLDPTLPTGGRWAA